MKLSKAEIFSQCDRIMEQIREVRRTLHRYPELSFHEEKSCTLISEILTKEGIGHRIVAKTGILAEIAGGGKPSKEAVVLRADMDALPIREETGLPYASENGAMHACGHDIHTASLLGTAILLHRNRDTFEGTVLCLFQPGEELWPGGASIVLKEGVFDAYTPKLFIGEHVAHDIPVGKYGIREGLYMASADEVRIRVEGTGGHGALPDTLTDPVIASAALILSLQQIVSRNLSPIIPSVLSIGKVIADGATNVIPEEVRLEGTLRTLDETARAKAKERIREISAGTAAAYGVKASVDIKDGYPAVVNDIPAAREVRRVLSSLVGEENIESLAMRMTGEDFGYFARTYPAVFFRLGVMRPGESDPAGLHTPHFHPDDDALRYGMAAMTALALHFSK